MTESGKNFKTLWKMMQGHRLPYLYALLAMFCGVLMLYVTPLITRAAIDGVIDSSAGSDASTITRFLADHRTQWGTAGTLTVAASAAIVVTAVAALFMNLQSRISGIVSETIARQLRNRLAAHLQLLPMAWHDKVQTGDIVQRCTSDVDTVRLFYREQVIEIARATSRIAIGFPVLLWLDWKMAISATALMPIIIAFAIVFFSKVQGTFKKAEEAEGIMTSTLQENLTGVRVVRAFARQDFEIERFTQKNAAYRDKNWQLFQIMAVYWSASDFMCFFQFATVVFVGAFRVSRGTITVGTMIAFISYAQLFIWPVREVGRVLTELGKTLVAITRIQEVLDVPEEAPPVNPMPSLRPVTGHIELSHVSFAFAEKMVLQDISLSIAAGSTIGILGASGAGKTTLVNLLLRLYDPSGGTITLDGIDIASMERKSVRDQFGVVLQEPFLYSKTLRENIKLASHRASDEEMIMAARTAAIHESIESFEAKYDTLIGERGVTLSGGQRQRAAIARALLKKAPILILDDALSAVDTHTEAAILHDLRQQRGRCTTIIIAHRLSTLMHADQIAVMESGRIVQLGTHDELVLQDGLYRRLWEIQGLLAEDMQMAELPIQSESEPATLEEYR